jgi:hypothetical protein
MAGLAGLGMGAAVDGLVDALVGRGISECEAKRYEGQVNHQKKRCRGNGTPLPRHQLGPTLSLLARAAVGTLPTFSTRFAGSVRIIREAAGATLRLLARLT